MSIEGAVPKVGAAFYAETAHNAALVMKHCLNGLPYLSLPYQPLTISLNSSEPGGSKLAFNS